MIRDPFTVFSDLILETTVDHPVQETSAGDKPLTREIAAGDGQVVTDSDPASCESSRRMEIETKDSTANSECIENPSPLPPPVAAENVFISEPSAGESTEFHYDFQPENFHAEQVR